MNKIAHSRLYTILLLALYAAAYSIEARKLPFAVLGRRTIAKGGWDEKKKDNLQILQQTHGGKMTAGTLHGSLEEYTNASLQLRGGGLGFSKTSVPHDGMVPAEIVLGVSLALLLPYLVYTVYDPLGGASPSALPRVEKACQWLWQGGFVGIFMFGLGDLFFATNNCQTSMWSEAPMAMFAIVFFFKGFRYPSKILHSSISVGMVSLWLACRVARGACPHLTDQQLQAFHIINYVPAALIFAASLISMLKE
jgi:hypothetical protein